MTSVFLTNDFKSSNRIETVLGFITKDQSRRTSKNVPIGWGDRVGSPFAVSST